LVLLFLLAVVWNPVVRRLGLLKSFALGGRELILVACLTYVVAGVAGNGAVAPLVTAQVTPNTLEKNRNYNPPPPRADQQEKPNYYKAYPTGVLKHDDPTAEDALGGWQLGILPEAVAEARGDHATVALIRGLEEGDGELSALTAPVTDAEGNIVGPSPASKLTGPMIQSGTLILIGFMLVFGLIALTARQWTHHERLQHPLIQVPAALADRSLLRNRGFLIAFGTVIFFWVYQLGSTYGLHPLPQVQNQPLVNMPDLYKLFGMDAAPGWPQNILKNHWGAINIFPFAIGIAFLLASDVGFSIWGGFFFGVVIVGWLYSLGVQVDFGTHGRLAGGGATLAMAGLILWLGRYHYFKLLKAAIGAGQAHDDPLGVLGARATLVASILLTVLLAMIFGSFAAGILATLLAIAFLLVIARVVAESGLACFQAAHTLTLVTYGLGLPFILPLKATLGVVWLASISIADTRENLAGFAVQSVAMGERAGLRLRRLLSIAFAVTVIVAVLAAVTTIAMRWTGGGISSGRTMDVANLNNTLGSTSEAALFGMTLEQTAILAGVLLVFAVAGLRRIWVGCPLHPIGLVVAPSWPIFLVWGSLALGWLIKVLVLRYGGSQLYKNLKPAAVGLILGDAIGFGLQLTANLVSEGWLDLGLDTWRTWP
jgi:hypothetical protein